MSNPRLKCKESIEVNKESLENLYFDFEFEKTICFNDRIKKYLSSNFIIQDTTLVCQIEVTMEHNVIFYNINCLSDDSYTENNKPYIESFSWYNGWTKNEEVALPQHLEHLYHPYHIGNFNINGNTYVKHKFKFLLVYLKYRNNCLFSSESLLKERIKKLYNEMKFTDVKIHVKNEIFLAHKAILDLNPVLSKMLNNNTLKNEENVINIEDMDPEIFKILLRLLYLRETGEINFEKENINFLFNLYKEIDKYQINYIKDQLIGMLIRDINKSNVIDVLLFSERFLLSDLQFHSMTFIVNNHKSILNTDKFQKLKRTNPKLLMKLVIYCLEDKHF